MKRNWMAMILTLCLIVCTCAGAEGVLPSLTDTIGKPMPSLGEALGRYPDDEIHNDNGSNSEVFHGVTEIDFNTFSVYLSEQGAKLADYLATGTAFSASIQVEDKTISFTYDTQTLEATLIFPQGTYDQWLKNAKGKYENALTYLENNMASQALEELRSIANYEKYAPAMEILATNIELQRIQTQEQTARRNEEIIASIRTDDHILFGHYEQDNDKSNGKEPIEWIILNRSGDRLYIISRYGLDSKPFNETAPCDWKDSSLRKWLNNTFLSEAFTVQEQSIISDTEVDNSSKEGYRDWGTPGSSNTRDKIFLLSGREAFDIYFPSDNVRAVQPTKYARAQGGGAGWWTRSPGRSFNTAMHVCSDGHRDGHKVYYTDYSIRPVLWIDLRAGNLDDIIGIK